MGMTMRLCTVICGHVPEPARHLVPDYGACFESLLGPHLPGATFSQVAVLDGERIEDIGAYDVYVFTGSPAGVYEDMAWIKYAEQLVRDVVGAGKCVLGICFGHQLVAQALGGRVEKSDKGWGMGVHTVKLVDREPWMRAGAEDGFVNVIVSHQDQVVTPPDGAKILISTDFCPVGMMRVGDRVLTLQGHPEMQIGIVDTILEMRRERVGDAVYSSGKASLNLQLDHDLIGSWLAAFATGALGAKAA
jgi:GMP synthase-like glutamine amidotransferase